MRFSVVINTYNRASSLPQTLDALRHQTHADFEVIVVNGPSDDGTSELLAARAGDLRVIDCPERNLAISRNLGIDAAAGEVVAFIDDDAIPEARWLEQLAVAYDDPQVAGAGGLVLDQTGVIAQYRYSVCDRQGRTNFDQRPPLDRFNAARANPFVYLQGTNCSFRRAALAEVAGFDEEIEYNFDESELCSRILDQGHRLAARDDAVVHHKFLPSHMRRKEGFTDPFMPIKNRAYFALRVGAEYYPVLRIMKGLTDYVAEVLAFTRGAVERGEFTQEEYDFFQERAEAGFALGVERGLRGTRRGRAIAAADPDAFRPYPVIVPDGRRLAVAFVSMDYPPKPLGGIGRFTHDLARGFAAAGHEAHVVTRDDAYPYRVDFEEGVWVHRYPVGERWLPDLEAHPLRGNLEHAAQVYGAIDRIAERVALDVVSGSLWVAEPLVSAFDPRWATSVACNTPMSKVAELQPATAAAPLTPHQVRLEATLLRSPATLQPVSHENARLVADVTDKPTEVIWHGVEDRRRTRGREDDAVEILFVGRLEPRKGIDTLLEAGAGVLRAHPEARLVIMGGDNPHANGRPGVFTDWVAEHAGDVAARIGFRGHVTDDDLAQAYADCDIFCAPSRYESFGLVHVEAMMNGRPVIGADAGGMRETIVDGETGVLVAPGDAGALRDALERLVSDAALRERMGAAGRARYEAEFRNDVAVARNVALYERLSPPEDTGGALEAALAELCDLDAAAAARVADRLRDRGAFPEDHEAGVRAALEQADPGACTDGLYRALLGRAADEQGLASYVPRLAAGEDRVSIVREIARSDEARARGTDLRFLERLPRRMGATLIRDLGAAWLADDDEAFASGVASVLGVDTVPGGDRHAAVREIFARPEIVAAYGRYIAAFDTLQSTSALVDGLVALRERDNRAFVAGAYRLILGREADETGLAAYTSWPRSRFVTELATSEEAAARGFTGTVAERLAAAVQPAGGLRRRARDVRSSVTGTTQVQRTIESSEKRLERAVVIARNELRTAVERASPTDRLTALEASLLELASASGIMHDDLGQRFGTLLSHQYASDRDTHEGLTRSAQAVEALREQVEVMARKHEAMAMDMRERLPPLSFDAAPEPQIINPDAVRPGVKVNLGCGEKPLPGYVNVDFRSLEGVDVVADVGRLPFEPGTLAEVCSHHLIEHFRERQAETVLLPYWRSLLAPDGLLRIITPNWAVLLEQLNEGRLDFPTFKQVTFGLQDYSGDDHFAMYNPQTLTRLVQAAGFTGVEIVTERRQNGLSPEVEITARPA